MLPPLYSRWIAELLRGPIPSETQATCGDCAMCSAPENGNERRPLAAFFSPRIKCCSYVPELPNFLAGAILDDEDPALATGRASVEERIAAKAAVTPLGLARTPVENLLYDHFTRAGGFGRASTVRCPHYVDEGGGRCSIWRHRNAVCTTFFCKHDRGATGSDFWSALGRLLSRIEADLACWCVLELGLDPEALERLFPGSSGEGEADPVRAGKLDGVPDEKHYRTLWGRWEGREAEYYRECAARVTGLSCQEILEVCGPRTLAAARLTHEAYRKPTGESVPARLRAEAYRVLESGTDSWRLETYSALDPVELPRELVDVLHCFDGRPTEQVCEALKDRHGILIGEDLIRRLVDFRVLIPADGA